MERSQGQEALSLLDSGALEGAPIDKRRGAGQKCVSVGVRGGLLEPGDPELQRVEPRISLSPGHGRSLPVWGASD